MGLHCWVCVGGGDGESTGLLRVTLTAVGVRLKDQPLNESGSVGAAAGVETRPWARNCARKVGQGSVVHTLGGNRWCGVLVAFPGLVCRD
ncbi:hypothetical protein CLOM_g21499 [Closterium sp. NIES-68]|nr:hypothetical protein CLOM_g21499 [Closterium sp. NIES-68]